MSKMLPNDIILLLSGVSCVGKTTTAFNLINSCSEFKVVTELDIIRTVIRETINNVSDYYKYFDKEAILKEYSSLFESLTTGSFDTLKKQAKILLPYIKKIIYRQQEKNIPTIIEGMSIVPELFFNNNYEPLEGFKHNIVFVNLYISNKDEHLRRRSLRCQERQYDCDYKTVEEKIDKMWDKNITLHNSTYKISQHTKNVYSIDISNLSEIETTNKVIHILYNLFT